MMMINTLSLHDALPISCAIAMGMLARGLLGQGPPAGGRGGRSEEHTSELQSHSDVVCRLLPEKKKTRHFPLAHTGPPTQGQPAQSRPTRPAGYPACLPH